MLLCIYYAIILDYNIIVNSQANETCFFYNKNFNQMSLSQCSKRELSVLIGAS